MTGPLARAYAACLTLAASHYENFPVASRLLPAPMRPHVAAVYAFARVADDIADEGHDAPEQRRVRLLTWTERLHSAVESGSAPSDPGDRQDDLIIAAAAHSIRALDLPLTLFDDLVSAFAQDITTSRYDSWTALLDYCRRSANPVGRLVLRIAGYRDEALEQSSDALCTALQLANFWQDFGRDWRAGRLYVPADVWRDAGASEHDLAEGRMTPAWTEALARCIDSTRSWFMKGRAVADGVRGRLRLELRFTWLGGVRILQRSEQLRGELLHARPTLGFADVPILTWRAVRWRQVTA